MKKIINHPHMITVTTLSGRIYECNLMQNIDGLIYLHDGKSVSEGIYPDQITNIFFHGKRDKLFRQDQFQFDPRD